MKIFLSIFSLLYSLTLFASESSGNSIVLTKDSIAYYHHYLKEGWKFMEGDDTARAQPFYDDRTWKTGKSTLNRSNQSLPFNGIGWFRLHFTADSSITGRPLAMTMTHFGASEIYLDGKKIQTFGHIQGADSSVYFDPQELPFIFTIPNPGEHVLAVRYANYNADYNYDVFNQAFAGFKLMIGETAIQIEQKDLRSTVASFVLMLLCGIFFALCLIHLFMYLYFRHAKSNLYFSILMFSLAMVFVLLFIYYASTSPSLELKCHFLINPALVISCMTLTGFINELFNKNKIRLKIIIAFGLLTLALRFLGNDLALQFTIALIIGVSFDALFTVLFAIVKRVQGARIIGTGILFSTLFILTTFTSAFIQGGDLDLNDSTLGGQILIVFSGLAILSIPFSMSVYLAWNFSSINKNLALQLEQIKVLSEKSREQEQEKQRILETKKEELEKEVWERTAELRDEKKKSDDLLLNILPAEVAEELKTKGRTNAKTYSLVTVMFTDFKDFTEVSEKISAELLVAEIDYCFSAFDHIIQKYRIEKIKTIGDAYICASGLPVLNFTHAFDMIQAAIDIRDFMLIRKKEKEQRGEIPFELRIGIHTGPVVAGIVGVKKFAYDIWGDTVNLAARMESSGEAGKINISGATFELVKDRFRCIHRGKIQAKNKGEIDMYFIEQLN